MADNLGLPSSETLQGSEEMKDIFGSATIFENPKPVGLLVELLKLGTDDSGIVLDFFAGSGSTAHAVMGTGTARTEGIGSMCWLSCQNPALRTQNSPSWASRRSRT